MSSSKKDKKDKKVHHFGLPHKIILAVLGVAVVIVAAVVIYNTVHYKLYDGYKKYLTDYEYEEGSEFTAKSESKSDVEGMVLVAENDILKLYTDTETANVAVYDKRNGKITYSNPIDLEDDPIANESNKNDLRSQLIIDYYNTARNMGTYDSYSKSVQEGRFEVESIENGVRYIYTIGDFSEVSLGLVPRFITKEKLDEVCANLSDVKGRSLAKRYESFNESKGMYELNQNAQNSFVIIRSIEEYFIEAGWTEEDYDEQAELAGEDENETMSFVIPVEYRLADDGINVSVPAKGIQEKGGGKLYNIKLLSYFGAAGTDKDGYIVVPNGSGSLINYNNGKTADAVYSQYVYGLDPLVANYTQLGTTQDARLPLCAMCEGDEGLLMTVEDGAATAYFTAGVSGKNNSYNYMNTTFVVRGFDLLSMFGTTGNEADLPILEEDFYDANYTVRYTMLDDTHSGYSGVANYYRERLVAEGVFTEKTESGDIPFYYDIIGGAKATSSFVGIQYLKQLEMTTFDEAKQISLDLSDKGIKNQVMNYQGWSNGGYFADVYDKITKLGKLGGKKDLEALNDSLAADGGTLFVDVPFQNVTDISKRYKSSSENSRYYAGGYVAQLGVLGFTNYRTTSTLGYDENITNLLSPKFLTRYVDGFIDDAKDIDVDGISLRDLGNVLHSDKKRTNVIDREQALDIVLAQFEKLNGLDRDIMVSDGNAYTFAYADHIINAPISHNSFSIIDEEIPLYEMVIHGYINYAGKQLNYHDAPNTNEITLRMIEYGASPHYLFTWESAYEMKDTALNKFYATKYTNWSDDAVEMYNTVNSALSKVSGETIVEHEIIQEGVKKITYSNGAEIYVNYTSSEVKVGSVTVPAESFAVEVTK
ncbi:MAG: DUF5696 domain-containing protein [Butyrivibrio sp.]|nr:DUF5696 domain-containing protein [Butyrivibrio sp.]